MNADNVYKDQVAMNPYSTDKPHLHVFAGTIAELDQYVYKLRFDAGTKVALRVLRGTNMQRMEGFYDELAAALQFPLYFGRNWPAVDECLADLDWMPAGAYLLVFADAPLVLKSAGDGDAEALFKLLSRICGEWAEGSANGPERKPTPFHVVFHAGIAEADDFSHRVENAIGTPVFRIAVAE
jgi:hypothetical protein